MPERELAVHTTDIVLHNWALGVQLGIVSLVALFFFALARWVRGEEVRIWSLAWVVHALGLAAGVAVALQVVAPAALPVALSFALGGKTAFALLVVRGAEYHMDHESRPGLRLWQLVLLGMSWGTFLAFVAPDPRIVSALQWLIAGTAFVIGATRVLHHARSAGSRWLGWVLLGAGALYLHYVPLLVPMLAGESPLQAHLTLSPFFEAGGELVLALSTIVAIESSTSHSLRMVNLRLIHSQEQLRQLADLDPLTGLRNRRGLREVLDRVRETGATLIFLDIDHFKDINDRSGHEAGDLCLLQVSRILQQEFRSDDSIFRWGGDEFLIVAPGLEPDVAAARVEKLRADLAGAESVPSGFSFSAGISSLRPFSEPETALREADRAMYEHKRPRPPT
jgi:diguanylate cyclase (GGDEF)-like protein